MEHDADSSPLPGDDSFAQEKVQALHYRGTIVQA